MFFLQVFEDVLWGGKQYFHINHNTILEHQKVNGASILLQQGRRAASYFQTVLQVDEDVEQAIKLKETTDYICISGPAIRGLSKEWVRERIRQVLDEVLGTVHKPSNSLTTRKKVGKLLKPRSIAVHCM